jgi:hypothetical protein
MTRNSATAAVAVMLASAASGLGAHAAGKGMQDVPAVVADIMGQTQLRHIKLGYAGRVGNWPLAAYETGQIRRSFDDAAKAGGKIDDRSLSQWFDEQTLPALDELQRAIAAKDVKSFNAAFADLTAACNRCHQAANMGFVRMQTPTASPFSNQSFPP